MTTTTNFAPKRGRPSAQQVAAIDRAILDTARRIFLDTGYDMLAMDGVASTLGISKGTLYARYGSKEALMHAVVKDSIASWSVKSSLTDPYLPDELGPRLRARLREFGRSMANPEAHAYYRLGTSIRDKAPEIAALFYEQGFLRGVEVIAQDLRAEAAREGVTIRDADAAAAQLMYTYMGWHVQESSIRRLSDADVVAFADRAVEFFMLSRSAW